MRIARDETEFEKMYYMAQREALTAFGNGELYIEKYIAEMRHIEVQILGDAKGNIIHLGERDCSIQRRHQKLIEESPSIIATQKFRKKIGDYAVKAARALKYRNAGTVEFIVDPDNNIFFMEMNTRLQVEHPVTEYVSGVDIVKEQIKIAAGLPLEWKQTQIKTFRSCYRMQDQCRGPGEVYPLPREDHVSLTARRSRGEGRYSSL